MVKYEGKNLVQDVFPLFTPNSSSISDSSTPILNHHVEIIKNILLVYPGLIVTFLEFREPYFENQAKILNSTGVYNPIKLPNRVTDCEEYKVSWGIDYTKVVGYSGQVPITIRGVQLHQRLPKFVTPRFLPSFLGFFGLK